MESSSQVSTERGVTTITAQCIIQSSLEEVWEVIRKPGNIADFHPLIKTSSMERASKDDPLGLRHCALKPMGEMLESISDWQEGRGYTTTVVGGSMLPPHKFMKGRLDIISLGGNTQATFSFSYQLKFGLLGQIMNRLLIRPQFRKAPLRYVMGLKEFTEGLAVEE